MELRQSNTLITLLCAYQCVRNGEFVTMALRERWLSLISEQFEFISPHALLFSPLSLTFALVRIKSYFST